MSGFSVLYDLFSVLIMRPGPAVLQQELSLSRFGVIPDRSTRDTTSNLLGLRLNVGLEPSSSGRASPKVADMTGRFLTLLDGSLDE